MDSPRNSLRPKISAPIKNLAPKTQKMAPRCFFDFQIVEHQNVHIPINLL
jgi:hypothetical protein